MEWVSNPEIWMALATLTVLEVVLGVDNIIFFAILAGRLPEHQQAKGRTFGLILAMVTRIILLFSLILIMRLTTPLFSVLGQEISGRAIILLAGGLFLIGKSTLELHNSLEGEEDHHRSKMAPAVRPAPNASIRIIWPGCMRPSLTASSIAVGTVAADVFP